MHIYAKACLCFLYETCLYEIIQTYMPRVFIFIKTAWSCYQSDMQTFEKHVKMRGYSGYQSYNCRARRWRYRPLRMYVYIHISVFINFHKLVSYCGGVFSLIIAYHIDGGLNVSVIVSMEDSFPIISYVLMGKSFFQLSLITSILNISILMPSDIKIDVFIGYCVGINIFTSYHILFYRTYIIL